MTYNELKNEENKYVMNTYGRFPIALDHGKGATLWDVEGKKYIDLASGIGVNCMGYDNQILIDAITRQAHKIMHASNLFHHRNRGAGREEARRKDPSERQGILRQLGCGVQRGCDQARAQVFLRQVR